jgi:hypothetical protein
LQLGAIYIYFAPKNCKKITDFFPTKFLILWESFQWLLRIWKNFPHPKFGIALPSYEIY